MMRHRGAVHRHIALYVPPRLTETYFLVPGWWLRWRAGGIVAALATESDWAFRVGREAGNGGNLDEQNVSLTF